MWDLILIVSAGAAALLLAGYAGYLSGRADGQADGYRQGYASGHAAGRHAGQLEQLQKAVALTRCLCRERDE